MFFSLPEKDQPLPLPFIEELSLQKTGVESFQKDLRLYHDHFFEDLIWYPFDPRRRIGYKPSTRSIQFLKSENSSQLTMQELRSYLRNNSTCGNKLLTMYLTRSGLSRPGVFLLVTGTPVPATRHRVVTCCDHFLPRRQHGVLQRPSRLCPTKLIYEPGFFDTFLKLIYAESSCVPGGAPFFTAPSRIHWLTLLFYAELNSLVITQGYYLEDAPVTYL